MIKKRIFYLLIPLITFKSLQAQQSKQVTGKVIEEGSNSPLPGVNITIKGTSNGAVTDVSGNYSIKVPQKSDIVLQFKYLGFTTEEIALGSQTVLNVKLKQSTGTLEEVVVIGYGQVQRRDLTGSVSSVNITDLQKAPVGSAIEALAGRVAGVQVSSESGQPGAGFNIIIRGASSLTQDNSPLYVIDGFPTEDANAGILNPAEIESMEVLKDASATAIYGARGANGVILITTKRAKIGAPTISYTGYYGAQEVIKSIDVLSPYEFVRMEAERDPVRILTSYFNDGKTLEDYRNIPGTNWEDLLLRTAPMQDHSILVSSGTKTTKYTLSGNLFKQDGIIVNSSFDRKQGRFNIDQTINNKLNIGGNALYSSSRTSGNNPVNLGSGGASNSAMSGLFYSVWGYFPISPSGVSLEDELVDPNIDPITDYRINPVLSTKNELRELLDNRLVINGFLEYALNKNLKFRASGGINQNNSERSAFNNSLTRGGSPFSLNKVNGSISFNRTQSLLNENLLTYNKKINKDHVINIVGGVTFQQNTFKSNGLSANLLPNEILGLEGLGQGNPLPVTAVKSEWSMISYLSRFNYNYKSKYLLTASFRADGSSKFREGSQWGYFPSGAFAWRIINEAFMKEQNLLSDAKIRIGYGVTGNNRVTDYASYSGLNFDLSGAYYSFNNVLAQGAYPSTIANPDLRWESTAQSNLGLDLGVFNQRLTLIIDYYKKVTSDLLLNASLPLSTGYTNSFKNIGKTSNEGLEFSFNSININHKNFGWTSSFNISFNRNKVLQLTENQESITNNIQVDVAYRNLPLYLTKINQPLGQMYGFIWDGLYQMEDFNVSSNGAISLKDEVSTNGNARANIRPGDIKYKDLNRDGVVNDLDRTVIGRGYPLHIGGLANNFRYKKFDLNLFLQWSYGNDIINANRIFMESGERSGVNQFATFANRWTPDNTNTDIPRLRGQGPAAYSSRVVEDGSFLRLKTVALGYTLPDVVTKKLKIKSARIYTSAQNLLTFTKYSGYDPEVAVLYTPLTPGYDFSAYPRPRTFVLGFNVSL
ncbi:SusC/RagA family TonB-linked outer membrane protein [Pedobacter glucosidilyticus]|uniref:SusC/RagA family TonB-linked outer membrane protein n=1 Tax=Pedobacter glucosidilyticus TaxID=1122941 RepID=UPI000686C1C0|nr:TonB-dependent receptor [Pedobacter glucosidilyticus]